MATITVTNLNDSGSGSIREAVAGASAGDTIVFDSTLSGGTIWLQSEIAPTVKVIIDGSSLAEKITLDGGSGWNGSTNYPTSGCRAFNFNRSGVYDSEVHSLKMTHCYVDEYGGAVIHGNIYDCDISYSYSASNVLSREPGGGGMYSSNCYRCNFNYCSGYYGGTFSHGALYDCVIRNSRGRYVGGCGYYGDVYRCVFYGYTGEIACFQEYGTRYIKDCLFINCQAIYRKTNTSQIVRMTNCTVIGATRNDDGVTTNDIVSNNILSATPTSGGDISNNLIYQTTDTTAANYAGNIFTDFANGDYSLKAGSPAIDAGACRYVFNGDTDLLGNRRIQGTLPDLGCYEYNMPSNAQLAAPVLTATTSPSTGGDTVTLSWDDDGTGRQYSIHQTDSSGVSNGVAKSTYATSYAWGGLSPNTTYYFKVIRLSNDAGTNTSDWSNTVSCKTRSKLATPVVTIDEIGQTHVDVTYDTNNSASGYEIEYGTDSTFTNKNTITTNRSWYKHRISGLTAGTTYYIRVRFQTTNNSYAYSAWNTKTFTTHATTATKLPTPTVTLVADGTSVEVGGLSVLGATSYEVIMSLLSGSDYAEEVTPANGKFVFTGLLPRVKYFVKVRAMNSDATGEHSDWASEQTVVTGGVVDDSLDPPPVVAVAGTMTSIFLNQLGGYEEGGYRYRIATSEEGLATADPVVAAPFSKGSFRVMGLEPGVRYYVQACGVMGDKVSRWSEAVSALTYATVTTVTVTNLSDSGTGSLRAAVTNATTYTKVVFDSSLSGGTILLTSPLVPANASMILVDCSNLAQPITLDGQNGCYIMNCSSNKIHFWRGFVLRNGFNASGTGYRGGAGCYGCLEDCVVRDCVTEHTTYTTGGMYGGVSWRTRYVGNKLTATTTSGNASGATCSPDQCVECIFEDNESSYYGGAIYQGSIVNCIIRNNYAQRSAGGLNSSTIYYCDVIGNCAGITYGGGSDGASSYFTRYIGNTSFGVGGAVCGTATTSIHWYSLFKNNTAGTVGGGAYSGKFYNCIIDGNIGNGMYSGYGAGGTYGSELHDCVVINNRNTYTTNGGGCVGCTTYNCYIANNECQWWGAGTCGGTHYGSVITNNYSHGYTAASWGVYYNCLIYGNTRSSADVGNAGTAAYLRLLSCTVGSCAQLNGSDPTVASQKGAMVNCLYKSFTGTTANTFAVKNNMQYDTLDPTASNYFTKFFVGSSLTNPEDFKLCADSLAIGGGDNAYMTLAEDLAGNPRKRGTNVDVGCYEFEAVKLNPPTLTISGSVSE